MNDRDMLKFTCRRVHKMADDLPFSIEASYDSDGNRIMLEIGLTVDEGDLCLIEDKMRDAVVPLSELAGDKYERVTSG